METTCLTRQRSRIEAPSKVFARTRFEIEPHIDGALSLCRIAGLSRWGVTGGAETADASRPGAVSIDVAIVLISDQ